MNKNLYDRIAIIPDSLVKHLNDCFSTVQGNQNIEGYNRNQQLRQSKQATYQVGLTTTMVKKRTPRLF